MGHKKTLQELTIKDNFMFGAVMAEEENCRLLLERILGFPIEKVKISKEKSFFYHPEYKGVRLDIYAEDEARTCYNVEMQAVNEDDIEKRTRYYHSQIDMELLLSGKDYSELSDVYVIFICDFDPFKKKKYRYTFLNQCQEDADLTMNDGSVSIFLSTRGENEQEVPIELVRFLKFVKADLQESEQDFSDNLVEKLQESILHIKSSREMEKRYMLYELTLQKERKIGYAEGRAEAILDALSECGEVPEDLRERIRQEKDLSVLSKWLKAAFRSQSVSQFIEEM